MDTANPRLSLDGEWMFAMDPKDEGEERGWYGPTKVFRTTVTVPGSWQSQGIGYSSRTDNRRTITSYESFDELDPSFLTTPAEYHGTGWYRRLFAVPETWSDGEIWLCFDGIHPAAGIWIDGHFAGEHKKGPLEPCRLRITGMVSPGKEHSLVVRVSESLRILQGVVKWPYFSGLHKSAYLEATSRVWFEDLYVHTDIHTGEVVVEALLGYVGQPSGLLFKVSIRHEGAEKALSQGKISESSCTLKLTVPQHELWSPDSPVMYTCLAEVSTDASEPARKEVRFGFRELKQENEQLFLNDHPLFLRGTGLAGPMGLPGPEPAPGQYYADLVRRIKEYGFNYFRWHTYSCEPALLEAADEQGLLVQSELFSVSFETEEERRLTEEQCVLMVKRNRNHPCVAAWAMGNEHDSPEPLFRQFRDRLCDIARRMGPGVLVMDSDGVPDNYVEDHPESNIISAGLGVWVGSVLDLSPAVEDRVRKHEKPFLIHEFGYPESFPNVDDIPRYTGGIRPFWLEHTLKSARKSGLEDLLPMFVKNSRRLQLMIHRKAIEDVRKVAGLAGYNNWGFHDFLHESTGLVDLFLGDKDIPAAEFRKSNGDLILICEPLADRYTLTTGAPLRFRLIASNHGNSPLPKSVVRWKITCGEECFDSGQRVVSIGAFGPSVLGEFSATTPAHKKPYSIRLESWIEGTPVRNEWRFWAFPEVPTEPVGMPVHVFRDPWPTMDRIVQLYPFMKSITEAALWDLSPEGILLTPCITDAVTEYLSRGGRVILAPVYYLHRSTGLPMRPSSFGGCPSFAGNIGGSGTIINRHSMLGDFPHEGWCDLQWFDLVAGERIPHVCVPFHNSAPAVYHLDPWPVKIEPVIRSIPTWKNCENRAYLFEVRVGAGRLLATALRILETVFTRAEGRYLFDSMLRYAASEDFDPEAAVSAEDFNRLRLPAVFINE